MKRLTILGIIVCVGLVIAPAAVIGAGPPDGVDVNVANEPGVRVLNDDTNPVPVNVSTVYRFAGYSAGTTTGDAGGIIGMHSICQDTFGPDARMCTSEEFWRSPAIAPPGPGSIRWVQPSFIAFAFEGTDRWCMYFSGVTLSGCSPLVTSCGKWTSDSATSSYKGTVISADEGVISLTGCNLPLKVTCCLPASQSP
jgi:hypothetical protein